MNKHVEKFLSMGKPYYSRFNVVLRGRMIHLEVCNFHLIKNLCIKLAAQGWLHLFLDTELMVYKQEVVEFYENWFVLEGSIAISRR